MMTYVLHNMYVYYVSYISIESPLEAAFLHTPRYLPLCKALMLWHLHQQLVPKEVIRYCGDG